MSYSIQNFVDDTVQKMRKLQTASDMETPSDPCCQNFGLRQSMHTPGASIYCGRVTDTFPQLRIYRVQIPNDGVRICSVVEQAGGLVYSAMNFGAGDLVLVVGEPESTEGLILGRAPGTSTYGSATPRSFITLSDQFYQDAFQRSVKETNTEAEFPSRVTGLPYNSTDAGEYFIGSPCGPKLFTDPFMALLAVNDATGVWAFRDDSMLRLAGINYQKVTSGSLEECQNRNGDCIEYAGHALNSWEAFGYYRKPEKVLKDRPDWATSQEPVAFVEPEEPEARPFYRVTEFGGKLGFGKQSQVVAPPDTGAFTKYGDKEKTQCALSRVSQLADGFIGIESAKAISIVKRSRMPAVQRFELPEDRLETLQPLVGEPMARDLMQSLMAIADYSAYVFNYKTLYPFLCRPDEFFVPEDTDLPVTNYDLKSQLSGLQSAFMLPAPEPYTLTLDGMEHKCFPVEAGLHFLPDGGVVLHDGYGSELRMSGGQITLSAPGGIWIRSGKDIQLWSGRDLNVTTKEAVDVASMESSVRIKAERNLEMLGGNAGDASGVILESRGRGDFNFDAGGDGIRTGGIVLKAKDGPVATYGKSIYTRSDGGGMLFDAGGGREDLATRSKAYLAQVADRHAIHFARAGSSEVEAVQQATANSMEVPGTLNCGGGGNFYSDVYTGGSVYGGGHVYTKDAVTIPDVAPLKGKSANAFDRHIQSVQTRVTQTNPETAGKVLEQIQQQWSSTGKPGSTEALEKAGFSFRTDEELQLDGFMVYADRWQTVCDTGSSSMGVTKVVTASGNGEYPWPGKKYWEDTACFVTQTLVLAQPAGLKERTSVGEYSNPEYNEPDVQPLKLFPVIN